MPRTNVRNVRPEEKTSCELPSVATSETMCSQQSHIDENPNFSVTGARSIPDTELFQWSDDMATQTSCISYFENDADFSWLETTTGNFDNMSSNSVTLPGEDRTQSSLINDDPAVATDVMSEVCTPTFLVNHDRPTYLMDLDT